MSYEKYGFYKVDIDYVKELYKKDSQVYYTNRPEYEKKPYVGLITSIGPNKYIIPLTSAKQKHVNWANISKDSYVIYEIDTKVIGENKIYKEEKNGKYKIILAVLEIGKMIPVTNDLCTYIDFNAIDVTNSEAAKYKKLLEKEYKFLIPYKDKILKKAEYLYNYQKTIGNIKKCHCNFEELEKVCKNYKIEIVNYHQPL